MIEFSMSPGEFGFIWFAVGVLVGSALVWLLKE